MLPLVDIHCHLLAGLDDGPRTQAEAVEMCRMARDQGVQLMAAVAHQNERWSRVTPVRIRQASQELARALHESRIPVAVFPTAEVEAHPEIETSWHNGELLSVADGRQYLLVEMPHGQFVDLREVVRNLRRAGIRPILAHPERHAELLHESGVIEELIESGSLVQVSSHSVTEPDNSRDEKALRSWFRRGVVHLLGSDGHSPRRRPPLIVEAYRRIARWAGVQTADRICSSNGMAVLNGLPLRVPRPRRRWLSWTLGRR